jgi:hypothetical protein
MQPFIPTPDPSDIDIMSPDVPLLLIRDAQGETYEGQTGGVSCNHPKATGFVVNILGAESLGEYLDGPHHNQWCGFLDEDGLAALDEYLRGHRIPLRTTLGYYDEGWVSVSIEDTALYGPQWAYLQPYEDRSAILVWNNCD